MPFVGNVLNRLYNWVSDRDAGIDILAPKMDGEFNNVFDGVNQVLQGSVPFSGQIKTIGGTALNPAYSFNGDLDTGFYRKGENNICLSTGGVDKIDVNDTTTNFINTNLSHNGNTILTNSNVISTGTWTPTLYGSTTAGTTSYQSQAGTYVIINNYIARFFFRLDWNAITGTGGALIGGFPFVARNLNDVVRYPFVPSYHNSLSLGTNFVTGYLQDGTDFIRLTLNNVNTNCDMQSNMSQSGELYGVIEFII